MKNINHFVKACLCLSLPLGVWAISALLPGNPVQAQTNQSDITGPIIQPPTNQSDITGPIIQPPVESDISTTTVTTTTATSTESTTTSTSTESTTTVTTTTATSTPTGGTATSTPTTTTATSTPTGGTATSTPTGGTATSTPTTTTATSTPTEIIPPANPQIAPRPVPEPIRVQPFFTTPIVVVLQTLTGGIRVIGGNAGNFFVGGGSGAIRILSFGGGVTIVVGAVTPGSSAAFPIMPTSAGGALFTFVAVVSGFWCDPPVAEGYRYAMTSDSLFAKIVNFPAGFAKPFRVSVGDKVIGEFKPGDSVDFTSFPGGGVKEFTITGIQPLTDPEDPTAFPLQIAFTTQKADFTMEAIQNMAAVEYYKANPPEPKPFKITIVTPDGKVELEPKSTSEALTAAAATLTASPSDVSSDRVETFVAAVESVKRDLNSLSANFEGLFPPHAGLNVNRLNPTMASATSLRRSLPILLQELKALPKDGSPKQAAAVANILKEIEDMTVVMEAMTPVLNQVSEAVVMAR